MIGDHNWKYPLTMVPAWCLMPLAQHNEGVDGCWGIHGGHIDTYADCVGCEHRGGDMSGPLNQQQMAAQDYTKESWAYTEATINLMRDRQHRMMTDKGFHDPEIEAKGAADVMAITRIALIHTEAGEATEEVRAGQPFTAIRYGDHGKPEGLPIEMADIVLRVMDFCGHYGIDLGKAIREKYEYTKLRPHRHGGKKV